MTPGLWGTITACSWGTADFAARFSGRALGHHNALLGMLLVGAAGLTAWVGFAEPPLVWHWPRLWLLLVSGVGVMVATLLLYQGLTRGPVTIVAPIVGSYPALVVAIAVALGARPSPLQWAAMAVVLAGVVIVARCARRFEVPGAVARHELHRTVAIALASAAGFSVAVSAGQAAAPIYGELQTVWVSRVISLVSLLLLFLVAGRRVRLSVRWWPVLGAQGVLDTSGYLALFAGSQALNAEIAAVTASGFGAVTVVLARCFLREAMTGLQWLGVVLLFAGVAVLSAPA